MNHFAEVSLSLRLNNLNISLLIEMMHQHSLKPQQSETSNNDLVCILLPALPASDIKSVMFEIQSHLSSALPFPTPMTESI